MDAQRKRIKAIVGDGAATTFEDQLGVFYEYLVRSLEFPRSCIVCLRTDPCRHFPLTLQALMPNSWAVCQYRLMLRCS